MTHNIGNNSLFNTLMEFSLQDWQNKKYECYTQLPALKKIDFSQTNNLSLTLTPIDKIYSFKEKLFPQSLSSEKMHLQFYAFTSAARHTALEISANIDKLRQILKLSQHNLLMLDNSYSEQVIVQKQLKENAHLLSLPIQNYLQEHNSINNLVNIHTKNNIAHLILINQELEGKISAATKLVLYINKIPLTYQKALTDIDNKNLPAKQLKGRDFIEKIANQLALKDSDRQKLIYDSYGIMYYYQQMRQTPVTNSYDIAKFMRFSQDRPESHEGEIKAYKLRSPH